MKYKRHGRKRLAKWCDEQRVAYIRGELTQFQIEKLESIPGWTWDREYLYKDAIIEGIKCCACGNKLPKMPLKDHLDGNFNQQCPHL